MKTGVGSDGDTSHAAEKSRSTIFNSAVRRDIWRLYQDHMATDLFKQATERADKASSINFGRCTQAICDESKSTKWAFALELKALR
jgi:hypothetical protein